MERFYRSMKRRGVFFFKSFFACLISAVVSLVTAVKIQTLTLYFVRHLRCQFTQYCQTICQLRSCDISHCMCDWTVFEMRLISSVSPLAVELERAAELLCTGILLQISFSSQAKTFCALISFDGFWRGSHLIGYCAWATFKQGNNWFWFFLKAFHIVCVGCY